MTNHAEAQPVSKQANRNDRAVSDAELVRQAYQAVHEGRQEVLREFFAEQFVLILPPTHPFAGEYHGLREAGECLARTFHAVGMARSAVRHVAADGDGSAFVVFEMIWADGSTMNLLEWVRIEGHQITEIRPFSWNADLLRDLAGTPRATS